MGFWQRLALAPSVALLYVRLTLLPTVIAPQPPTEWIRKASEPCGSRLSVSARECPGATNCAFGQDCFAEAARTRARDADLIVTDTWISMGQEDEKAQSEQAFAGYCVDRIMLDRAAADALFLHCLPAFHNRETVIGEEVYQKFGLEAMEVTEAVFESEASIVFDQAENRLHTIKAVMVATLGS